MWMRVCAAAALVAMTPAMPAMAQGPAPGAAEAAGWVVLTVPDYLSLREKSKPPVTAPVRPPVRAALTEVVYELTAGDGFAAGTVDVTVDVLEDGWAEIPLPSGFYIRAARLGGRPVALADLVGKRGDPGGSRLLLSRKGRAQVSLDVVMPIASQAGNDWIQVPPSAALVRVVLTVPRADVELTASGGAVTERSATAQALRVVAHARPNETLALAWVRKRDAAEIERPLKLRGRVQHVIGLGEETGIVTARVGLEVLQGSATSVALQLPAGLIVNQVHGAHVADWDVQGSTLAVALLERVQQQTAFVVTGEFHPQPSGRVELPLLRMVAAERESGAVAVEVLGAGEVTRHEARGLDPTDPSELGDLLAGRTSPAIVAFRYRGDQAGTPRALALMLTRYAPQEVLLAAVDEARYRAIVGEDGRTLVEGRLAVRNNQRSFLGLTLPAGAALWSVAIDGRPVRPGNGPKGSLLIPLQKRRAGTDAARVVVSVMYVDKAPVWGADGEWRLTLPAIDLAVSQTGLTVHHSPRYRLLAQPGEFHARAEPPLSTMLQFDEEKARLVAGRGEGDLKAAGRADGFGAGTGAGVGSAEAAAPAPTPPQMTEPNEPAARKGSREQEAGQSLGGLVERYRREAQGVRTVGTLPVMVAFPATGPGVHLAAELTAESAAPSVAFTFKRAVK